MNSLVHFCGFCIYTIIIKGKKESLNLGLIYWKTGVGIVLEHVYFVNKWQEIHKISQSTMYEP